MNGLFEREYLGDDVTGSGAEIFANEMKPVALEDIFASSSNGFPLPGVKQRP